MDNIIDKSYLSGLKQLIISIKLLDSKFIGFSSKEKLLSNMKEIYNKLFLYDLYQGKHLIAVTGLQGAGKTRLVRELFDIPEGLLPENNSRGEKLPIFISENEVSKPTLYKNFVVNTEEGHRIDKEEISKEEFYKKSMQPDENVDLWLECVVPSNLLRDASKVIVLLPGYEKSKRDFSQKLLDFIVDMSRFSILVLNKNTYARKTTERMMKKIEEKFENLSPIIALTHGDEAEDQNETIRKSVIEEMEIENPNRVIVTGRTEVLGNEWKENIVREMENLWQGNVLNENSTESLLELIEILQYEIEEVTEQLLEVEKRNNINEIIQSSHDKNPSKQFREAYTRYLENLKMKLTDHVGSVDFNEEIAQLINNNSGFKNSIKKLFVGESFNDKKRLVNEIKEVWDNKHNIPKISKDISNNLMYESLEYLGSIETTQETDNDITHNIKEPKNIHQISKNNFDIKSIELTESLPKKEKNLQLDKIDFKKVDYSLVNINTYFMQNIDNHNSKRVSLKKNDYDVLVFMGAQFLNSIMDANNQQDKLLNIDESSTNSELSKVVFNIGDNTIQHESYKILRKSMLSLPLILGIDVAVDGEADILKIIPAMVTSLGATVGIQFTAAAVAGVSIGILAAGTTLFVLKQVMNDINSSQLKIYENTNWFLKKMKESYVNSIVENQRIIFKNMEQKLIRQESSLRGDDVMVGQLEECIYLASSLNIKNKKVLKLHDELSPLF